MRKLLAIIAVTMLAFPACAAPLTTAKITTESGKIIRLKLETATTEPEREHGLMDRDTLKPHDGMAFFFPHPSPQMFWMKNTRVPLDIIFIGVAGNIVGIYQGVPQSLQPVGPDGFITSVIEIDGGRAAKDGIAVGNGVVYEGKISPQSLAR